MNKVTLSGTMLHDLMVVKTPRSTSYNGVLRVTRKSGIYDDIPFTTYNSYITKVSGMSATVTGKINTRENRNPLINKKIASTITASSVEYTVTGSRNYNSVEVEGTVVGKPHLRHTPRGKIINNFAIATARPNGKTDLIHVIAWEDDAYSLGDIVHGERLKIQGRVQIRPYVKKDGSKHRVMEVCLTKFERGK